MNLHLQRRLFDPSYTIGVLSINGAFECFTLEDPDRRLESGGEKVLGKTAIPRGKYRVTIDFSQRFQRQLPRLLNVPDFTGIRIHSGNKSEETEGCILVGRTMKPGFIGESKLALESLLIKLFNALDISEEIWITIE